MKKNSLKLEKINISAKVKINKHKYTVTKRFSEEKKTAFVKTHQNPWKITVKKLIFY